VNDSDAHTNVIMRHCWSFVTDFGFILVGASRG